MAIGSGAAVLLTLLLLVTLMPMLLLLPLLPRQSILLVLSPIIQTKPPRNSHSNTHQRQSGSARVVLAGALQCHRKETG